MNDKIILTLMIISSIFTTHFISYEFGKKYQCQLDKDFVYSLDFSKCVRIGKENYKNDN